jgi:hypothetical protein
MQTADRYPELERAAQEIAGDTCNSINYAARHVESEMPYKAQCILELVIAELQRRV